MSLFRKKEDTVRDFYKQCFVVFERITHESIKYLAKENEELKERIKKYEDPEDLALIFMYCDIKAKDKIKELQERINKAIEYIESEYTITDDDVYLALYSSDGTLDKLEGILRGEENVKN